MESYAHYVVEERIDEHVLLGINLWIILVLTPNNKKIQACHREVFTATFTFDDLLMLWWQIMNIIIELNLYFVSQKWKHGKMLGALLTIIYNGIILQRLIIRIIKLL